MINSRNILIGLLTLAIIGLLISIRECRSNKQNFNDLKTYQQSLSDTLIHLKNNVVAKPSVYITPEVFMQVVDERDDLKKQLAIMKIKPKQVSNITTVVNTITLHDTLRYRDTIIGKVIFRDSIRTVTSQDSEYLVSSEKKFLFRKSEYDISVHHSNQDIHTIGVESLTIRPERKWYNLGWLKVGVGFIAGYAIFHK